MRDQEKSIWAWLISICWRSNRLMYNKFTLSIIMDLLNSVAHNKFYKEKNASQVQAAGYLL